MTKQEVLQGALNLNGSDKKYVITIKNNKIILESKFNANATGTRKGIFRCVAHLNDDNTYIETQSAHDGGRSEFGKVVKVQKTISFTFGGNDGVEVEKESFNSEEIKKILRDYLDSCGYQRVVNKKLIALCISILVVVIVSILIAVIISLTSGSDFIDTNGPENFALTEITRDDILSKDNDYSSSVREASRSGHHTNIIGTRLRNCDYDYISKSFGKIHGIMILQATKISENTLTLNINSSVKSGNAEIVIMVDGEYYCSVDVNQHQSITLQNVSNKEVIVKLAGEEAKMKIDVTRVY